MAINSSPIMLDPGDLSAEIHIPKRPSVNGGTSKKGPPYLKIGRHVRYRRTDVDNWLAAQIVETAK